MPVREAVYCCKLILMKYSCQSSEEQSASRYTDIKSQVLEVSIGNKVSIGRGAKGHMCYTLAENSVCILASSGDFVGN